MRFFTPELYLQFNSADDAEADAADEAWEAALVAYRQHIEHLQPFLSEHVRKLAGENFHDVELLTFDQAFEPMRAPPYFPIGPMASWSAVAVLSLNRAGKIVSLIYALCDHAREQASPSEWPFSRERVHWLYDEIDAAPDPFGPFTHRILLSDGRVLEIPFAAVLIHTVPIPTSAGEVLPRQSA